ncbi:hypothetical protein CAEBREN_09105 [Caenorhabditis brenneri]|uniref:C2H2-type domain-containing protein n=1 Tax=Caenorhabditis brenneri TaxID=135651 RepID=G0NYR7_CAEBE|nr:hypothetical protein CAEBREN_09105 [Caenorhabditis brenneri]
MDFNSSKDYHNQQVQLDEVNRMFPEDRPPVDWNQFFPQRAPSQNRAPASRPAPTPQAAPVQNQVPATQPAPTQNQAPEPAPAPLPQASQNVAPEQQTNANAGAEEQEVAGRELVRYDGGQPVAANHNTGNDNPAMMMMMNQTLQMVTNNMMTMHKEMMTQQKEMMTQQKEMNEKFLAQVQQSNNNFQVIVMQSIKDQVAAQLAAAPPPPPAPQPVVVAPQPVQIAPNAVPVAPRRARAAPKPAAANLKTKCPRVCYNRKQIGFKKQVGTREKVCCKFCTTTYNDRDDLVEHFLNAHKPLRHTVKTTTNKKK